MFHWQNNIYFGRRKNGSVRMIKFKQNQADWPNAELVHPTEETDFDLIIPDNHWGSIVASVSHAGEEDRRWYQAMEFHNGKS